MAERDYIAAVLDHVVVFDGGMGATLEQFCGAVGDCPPAGGPVRLEPGEVLFWSRSGGVAPFRVRVAPSRTERRRHTRKYAEGELRFTQ